MFNSDQPIRVQEQDLLSRNEFAKSLAEAIYKYTSDDPLTIGLYGAWGSGKTSLANLVLSELSKCEYTDQNPAPIIIPFNPWNFASQDQIIRQFFESIINTLDFYTKNDVKNDTKKALTVSANIISKIGQIAAFAQFIPQVAPLAAKIAPLFTAYAAAIRPGESSNDINLIVQKAELIAALQQSESKIIVIIDDIDRLTHAEIRQVFQAIKAICDFPNMIYVLLFDKDVVASALDNDQPGFGNLYLEKIVQIPVLVPAMNSQSIKEYLIDGINNIIEWPDYKYDHIYFGEVFANCVLPYLKTIRDANLILNVFRFHFNLLKDETNFIDLLALCTIQLFIPELYRWIHNHEDELVGPNESLYFINMKRDYAAERKQAKQHYLDELGALSDISSGILLNILSILFPAFHSKLDVSYSHTSKQILIRHQRLADPRYFKNYFRLTVPQNSLSRSETDFLLFDASQDSLSISLHTLKKRELHEEFLANLDAAIPELNEERSFIWLNSLINNHQNLKGYDESAVYIWYDSSQKSIVSLLEKFPENERMAKLNAVIQQSNFNGLAVHIAILEDSERYYNRMGLTNSHRSSPLIPENDLLAYEQFVVDGIKDHLDRQDIISLNSGLFRTVERFMESLDPAAWGTLMQKALKSPAAVARFLEPYVSHSTSEEKFMFPKTQMILFQKYISLKVAKERIRRLKNTPAFKQLPILTQKKTILFAKTDPKEYSDEAKDDFLSVSDEELQEWMPD